MMKNSSPVSPWRVRNKHGHQNVEPTRLECAPEAMRLYASDERLATALLRMDASRLSEKDLCSLQRATPHAATEIGSLIQRQGGENLRLRDDVVEREELLFCSFCGSVKGFELSRQCGNYYMDSKSVHSVDVLFRAHDLSSMFSSLFALSVSKALDVGAAAGAEGLAPRGVFLL